MEEKCLISTDTCEELVSNQIIVEITFDIDEYQNELTRLSTYSPIESEDINSDYDETFEWPEPSSSLTSSTKNVNGNWEEREDTMTIEDGDVAHALSIINIKTK